MVAFLINEDQVEIKSINNPLQETMWQGFRFGPGSPFDVLEENFWDYVAADWVVTETAGGATQALADEAGGVLLLTNTGTEDDILGMQKVKESFQAISGKTLYFEIIFKASEATEMDWMVGLCDRDTGLPLATPSDGIYFRKDDADANIDCGCSKSSVESVEAAAATFTASTYLTLGFKVIGTSKVEFWKDGSKIATITTSVPTTELCLTFTMAAGSTDVRTMNVKKITVAQQR